MTSFAAYECCTASPTPRLQARTLHGLRVPGAVLPGGSVLFLLLASGACITPVMVLLLVEDATSHVGGCLWRSSQHTGTGAASKGNSPHFVTQSLEQSMTQYLAQTKLIVFIYSSTNGNG